MNETMKSNYEKSIDFWNQAQIYSEADFEGEIDQNEDWKEIGSAGLCSLMTEAVKGWENVLDYGCGTGWLDVILAKNGVKGIKAVDVAENAVNSAKLYAKAFICAEIIDYEAVDVDWLAGRPENIYNHAVCCNVLDVVPDEVAESILENLARVCKPGATVLVTMNPHFTDEQCHREGMTYEPPYLYVNGVLRVNNRSDEEWTGILEKYFTFEKLVHFKWDAEQEVHRRLFYLKK